MRSFIGIDWGNKKTRDSNSDSTESMCTLRISFSFFEFFCGHHIYRKAVHRMNCNSVTMPPWNWWGDVAGAAAAAGAYVRWYASIFIYFFSFHLQFDLSTIKNYPSVYKHMHERAWNARDEQSTQISTNKSNSVHRSKMMENKYFSFQRKRVKCSVCVNAVHWKFK